MGAGQDDLKTRGFKDVTAEGYFPGPGGGTQGSRFADAIGYNRATGEVEIIQVGDIDDAGLPITRELSAIADILTNNADFADLLKKALKLPDDVGPISKITIRFIEKAK